MRKSSNPVIKAARIRKTIQKIYVVQAYEKVVLDLEASREQLQEKIVDLETFQDVVVGRELKMIALEKETAMLQRELDLIKAERPLA